MISIAIISFGSLIGALVFPSKEKKWFPYVIMFLIALGVSVLVGDAILHLLPHVNIFVIVLFFLRMCQRVLYFS